jgi:hypothetical protein
MRIWRSNAYRRLGRHEHRGHAEHDHCTPGSICLKRSTTVGVPNSGAQLDQIAPMLAQARKATTVSGTFGM